jgi:hypothetical protein
MHAEFHAVFVKTLTNFAPIFQRLRRFLSGLNLYDSKEMCFEKKTESEE